MTADTVGGVWQYSLELARALVPHGVEVMLATMGGSPSRGQRAAAAAIPGLDVWESSFRLEWMQESAADVEAAGEWLLGLERVLTPDVVHVNGYVHAALPWRAPVLLVAHSCVGSWWRALHGMAMPLPEWEHYRAGVMRGLAAAQRVIAPTRAQLEAMEREYGPIANAGVIANARSAAEYGMRRKQRFIITAGRLWDPAKNAAVLRAAAGSIRWPVLAAGALTGPDGRRFEPGALRATGVLDAPRLARLLGHAAVFVSTALYEPFGLSVLEAAHAGCALVLSDIPSFREHWQDAALFIDPRDPGLLASCLERLLADESQWRELGERARARSARFTPERMAHAYHATYTQLPRSFSMKAGICAS